MADLPEERVGFTDLSFCLLRYEIASLLRKVLYLPGHHRARAFLDCEEYFAGQTTEEKEKWVIECHQRLEQKYIRSSDISMPLYWVTAALTRLFMSKMWLVVYHPYRLKDGGAGLPRRRRRIPAC